MNAIGFNIRDKEIAALGKMISIEKNMVTSSLENFADQWKVLVYDEDCRDIISPLLNVSALRQKGVTLHLLLNSEREQISDAPAAYFIRPTEENIKRVADDCFKRLYRSFFLHFVTRIERNQLEKFAKDLVSTNSVSLISKVYDQYLDIIALEPYLFTLNIKNSFIAYNDPSFNELQIKAYMTRMAYGLLSMVRLLGTIPLIRAPPGGPAEMLAQDVCNLIREHISVKSPTQALFTANDISTDGNSVANRNSANSNTSNNSNNNRPLLLIYDRTCDMSPPLLHTSTYQALIDDLLDHKLNRVTIDPNNNTSSSSNAAGTAKPPNTNQLKKISYDLNTNADTFYQAYHFAPIPEAVEANVKDLEEVSKIEGEIRRSGGGGGGMMTDNNSNNGNSGGRALSDMIENLPEILLRKKSVETHTTLLGALMKKIKERDVPFYFEVEQNILSAGRVTDKQAVLNVLKDGNKGGLLDKARFLAILATVTYTGGGDGSSGGGSISNSTAIKLLNEEYDAAFLTGCQAITAEPVPSSQDIVKTLGGVVFLRKLLALQNTSFNRSGSGGGLGLGGVIGSHFKDSLKLVMDKATSYFAKFNAMYITKIVDNFVEGRSCTEDETFCYLDPKAKANNNASNYTSNNKYQEVIVFAIGGGCYAEYNNLQELVKQKQGSGAGGGSSGVNNNNLSSSNIGIALSIQQQQSQLQGGISSGLKSITYGCTELVSGDKFLSQLEALGTPVNI